MKLCCHKFGGPCKRRRYKTCVCSYKTVSYITCVQEFVGLFYGGGEWRRIVSWETLMGGKEGGGGDHCFLLFCVLLIGSSTWPQF